MNEYINLDSLTRNTRRLEFEDGLNDLQNGLVFLVLSLLAQLLMSTVGISLYLRVLLFNREIASVALIACIGLIVLVIFGARRAIGQYRKKVLWRDLGEIEPLKWQVDSRISILAAGIWAIMFVAGFFLFAKEPMDLDRSMRIIVAAGGAATGVVYFALGQTLAIARYRWVGLIGGLLSVMLMLFNVGPSWLAFGLIWTGTLGVSGVLALRSALLKLREGVS